MLAMSYPSKVKTKPKPKRRRALHRITPFDAADLLDSEEIRQAFLDASLDGGDAHVARAHEIVERSRMLHPK